MERGSVGIAQIQIDTAIFHKLVDVTDEEIEKYQSSDDAVQRFGGKKPSRNQDLRILVGKRLMELGVAIEAVAREIRKNTREYSGLLFQSMEKQLPHRRNQFCRSKSKPNL